MGSKILIVDDETPIRTLLRSAVAVPGFEIFEADCGRRALEIARREGRLALVVTDVLMPGMDGFELADELTRAGHAENFLFISGYCDEEAMGARIAEFPGAGFLSKPFPIPELLQAIHRMLSAEGSARLDLRRPA